MLGGLVFQVAQESFVIGFDVFGGSDRLYNVQKVDRALMGSSELLSELESSVCGQAEVGSYEQGLHACPVSTSNRRILSGS
ncbi:MAG: hypothetical protein AMXMBFR33_44500 [Candidatus Xenobia bacterium]